MVNPEQRGGKEMFFIDTDVLRGIEGVARDLVESNEEVGTFSPEKLTKGERSPSFLVQRNKDGIMTMGQVEVEGGVFFYGLEPAR